MADKRKVTKYNDLFVLNCRECCKVFRTEDPLQTICPECIKARDHRKITRKKKVNKKPLTFAEILHIAEVYNRVHHKYLHYGNVVALVDRYADHCVCCGAIVPEGRHVCPQCEMAVK